MLDEEGRTRLVSFSDHWAGGSDAMCRSCSESRLLMGITARSLMRLQTSVTEVAAMS